MDGFLCPIEHTEPGSNITELPATDGPRFVDTFRWLHPTELNAFSNWCTLTGARATNYGCRLDYIMADVGLVPCLLSSHILVDVEGSDHCPVVTELDCRIVTAPKCPPLCTKFLPQFAGRQQKLVAFFSKRTTADLRNDDSQSEKLSISSSSQQQLELQDNSGKEQCTQESSVSGSTHSVASHDDSIGVCGSLEEEFNFRLFECGSDAAVFNDDFSAVTPGSKRTATISAKQNKLKKAKTAQLDGKQSNLLNFFNKPRVTTAVDSKPDLKVVSKPDLKVIVSPQSGVIRNASELQNLNELPVSSCSTLPESKPVSNDCDAAKQPDVSAWKNLLKGPPQTPMCKGHNEPCVLRTVRKDGLNKGKQFWTCNRPEGHKNNPDARCDYFVWVKKH